MNSSPRVSAWSAPIRPVPALFNFAAFQGIWWVTILSAARGQDWVGPLALLPVLALHFWYVKDRKAEAWIVLCTAIPGFLLDSILGALGAFQFAAHTWLLGSLPPWMLGLWISFALTSRHALSWLHGRPLWAAVLGAVGGASTYWGGANLGALNIGQPQSLWLAAVGVCWALLCGWWFRRPLAQVQALRLPTAATVGP